MSVRKGGRVPWTVGYSPRSCWRYRRAVELDESEYLFEAGADSVDVSMKMHRDVNE